MVQLHANIPDRLGDKRNLIAFILIFNTYIFEKFLYSCEETFFWYFDATKWLDLESYIFDIFLE